MAAGNGRAMEPEHEAHLTRICEAVVGALQKKYPEGQLEHGGRLWEKPGMLAHAIDEATDQNVYLHTLREQLQSCVDLLTLADADGDWRIVDMARRRLADMIAPSKT